MRACRVVLLVALATSLAGGCGGDGGDAAGGADVRGDRDSGDTGSTDGDPTDVPADSVGPDAHDPDAAGADAGGGDTEVEDGDAGDVGDAAPDADHDAPDSGSDASDSGSDASDGGSDASDGGSDASDGGSDATDGGSDATDGGSDAPDVASDVPPGLDPETVLAELDADPRGTMLRYANLGGWPLPVVGGRLYVSLDPSLAYVAGTHDEWAGTAMAARGTYRWVVLPDAVDASYKFTDRADRWVGDPWSRSYRYDEFGLISLVAPVGQHIDRFPGVGGDGVLPRTIRVLVGAVPHDRVLYAHDGQNLFDPAAIWGGWALQDSTPSGVLVVGIDNTAERMSEYTHAADALGGERVGGGAEAYARFVQEVVRPLVRDRYGEPGPVGLMGSSLGGLVSLFIAHRYPDTYDFAASLSGTVGWGSLGATHSPTIIDLYRGAGRRSTALYIDSGGGADVACVDTDADGIEDDGASTDNFCVNAQLRDVLAGEGYEFGVDLWHWHEPGAGHNEAAWRARVWRPLGLFAAIE